MRTPLTPRPPCLAPPQREQQRLEEYNPWGRPGAGAPGTLAARQQAAGANANDPLAMSQPLAHAPLAVSAAGSLPFAQQQHVQSPQTNQIMALQQQLHALQEQQRLQLEAQQQGAALPLSVGHGGQQYAAAAAQADGHANPGPQLQRSPSKGRSIAALNKQGMLSAGAGMDPQAFEKEHRRLAREEQQEEIRQQIEERAAARKREKQLEAQQEAEDLARVERVRCTCSPTLAHYFTAGNINYIAAKDALLTYPSFTLHSSTPIGAGGLAAKT